MASWDHRRLGSISNCGFVSIFVPQSCQNKVSEIWVLNRNLSSRSSEGWKFRIKVSTRLISPEAPLLGLQMAAFSLCPHMTFPLCVCLPGVSKFLLIRVPVRLYWGLFELYYLSKGSVSKCNHIVRSFCGLWEFEHMNLPVFVVRHTIQSITLCISNIHGKGSAHHILIRLFFISSSENNQLI